MNFPDLSPYSYSIHRPLIGVLNVGWLDRTVPFTTGSVPQQLCSQLKHWFVPAKLNHMRGIHECNLCRANQWPPLPAHANPTLRLEDKDYFLGSWEMWIPGESGNVFASPGLIIHYIEVHAYRPPAEFVSAALRTDAMCHWNAEAEFSRRINR